MMQQGLGALVPQQPAGQALPHESGFRSHRSKMPPRSAQQQAARGIHRPEPWRRRGIARDKLLGGIACDKLIDVFRRVPLFGCALVVTLAVD